MTVDDSGQFLLQFERSLIQLLTPEEIFERADEHLIRKLHEDRRFELKPNGIHPPALGDYVAMWANTRPSGGIIVVGVRDDKKMEGCLRLPPEKLNEIERAGTTYAPDASYETRRVGVHRDSDGEQDFVIVIYVKYHATRVVKTVSGDIFVRRSDQKRLLREQDDIRQLQGEKGEVDFESEPCDLNYPDDFDRELIADFVSAVKQKKEWEQEHGTEEVLRLMHLGTRVKGNFVPSVACALLFANDPRMVVKGCRIRFLRFDGETEGSGDSWNAVKDDFIDGTIPQQIERAAAVVRSQLRAFSRLNADGKFYTCREYPEPAWYEAIVNACVHRSYGNGLRNAPTFIKMFDDRLIVESPGPLPVFVTDENIYDSHVPRNPFLMEALYFLKFVKMANEGTRRMRKEMLEEELPAPEWKQRDGRSDSQPESRHFSVRVTLRNNVKQRRAWVDSDVAHLLGAQVASTLDEFEKRIVNFCAENEKINVTQAQRLTGKRWQATKGLLMKLVARGILEQVHSVDVLRDSNSHYIIKKSPAPPKASKPK